MAVNREYIEVDGHRWAYLRIGTGRPLILLHGFMCYADYFLHMANYLKNDFELIIPDLPGFGFTPKLKNNSYFNYNSIFNCGSFYNLKTNYLFCNGVENNPQLP